MFLCGNVKEISCLFIETHIEKDFVLTKLYKISIMGIPNEKY